MEQNEWTATLAAGEIAVGENSVRIGKARDNQKLFEKLQAIFKQGTLQTRTLTTPGGVAKAEISWLKTPGIWASLSRGKDKQVLLCLFGSRLPESQNESITMDVQINLGSKTLGAAILDENGKLYLGHRGELRGGRATVTRQEFRERIRRFEPKNVMDGESSNSYFILGPIDADSFIPDLTRYVRECFRIRQEIRGLQAEDADEDAVPQNDTEALERRNISIKYRRGQQAFRRKLLKIYRGKCAISGCEVLDVLEAAHLKPYAGNRTNVAANGILLRADLHTLLDCRLLAIDPSTRRVRFSERVKFSASYKKFEGTLIQEPKKELDRPSVENLEALFKNLLK